MPAPLSPSIDRSTRRGFTLVESLIASVVLALTVVGIAGMLTASYQQSRDQLVQTEAATLARQLMEEISARPFVVPANETDKPGFGAGVTNRANYDDISDYHGYSDVSTSLKTLSGLTQSIGSAGTYTRSVSVTSTGAVPTGHTAPAGDFKIVTVTVTRPNAPPIAISKLFTRVTLVQ